MFNCTVILPSVPLEQDINMHCFHIEPNISHIHFIRIFIIHIHHHYSRLEFTFSLDLEIGYVIASLIQNMGKDGENYL